METIIRGHLSTGHFNPALKEAQSHGAYHYFRKGLEKIDRRIRDSSVGRSGYSRIDFVEDVKCACAREGVPFDNDIFNELVS